MPLLNKKPLERQPPPSGLGPNDLVYFQEATGEVFTDYDAFFNRSVGLNQTVWTCAMTGRGGLTFFEAIESEKEAMEQLEAFPDFLEAPILFLVHKYMNRGRLDDVVTDVTTFLKDRYFVGEEIFYSESRRKKSARVIKVKLQPGGEIGSERVKSSGGRPSLNPINMGIPPVEAYRYDLQIIDNDDSDEEEEEEEEEDDGIRIEVHPCNLSRNREHTSKAIIRLFLKNSVELKGQRQVVKERLRAENLLDSKKWTDIFDGPEPSFPVTLLQQRGRPTKTPSGDARDNEKKSPKKSKSNQEEKEEKASNKTKKSQGSAKEEGKGEKNSSKKPRKSRAGESASASSSPTKKISEKKRKQIAAQQDELKPQFETARRLGVEKVERWEQEEKVLTAKEIEMLREAIKEARVRDRESNRERKKREKELAAERKRPRDDLLCDDLKPLPTYAPLPLPPWMSSAEMAEYLTLFHFFISFQELLPIKEIRGTSRISFADIVIAVRCRDPRNSSLADLIRILMQAKGERAEEEDGDEANLSRREEIEAPPNDLEHPIHGEMIRERNELHEAIRETHGHSVRHLPLDWLTMTEVLRLHLLTCGYYTGVITFRHRQYQRGGPRCFEDAAYQFCEKHPDVLARLETSTIFDLSSSERLSLLRMLTDQLLSYNKFRAYHDDRYANLVDARRQHRLLRNWSLAQEKEARDAELTREYERDEVAEKGAEAKMERVKPSKDTLRLRGHLRAIREGRRTDKADLEELVLGGIAYSELELEEIIEAREWQRDSYQKGERAMLDSICDLEAVCCLVCLGRDRAHRTYFLLDAIPAVLVEETSTREERNMDFGESKADVFQTSPYDFTAERAGPCDEATPIADASPWKGNSSAARVALLGCTANRASCPVHGEPAARRPRWSYIDDPAKIEQLITACNIRGLRESELVEELISRKERLCDVVEKSEKRARSGQLAEFFACNSADPATTGSSMDWHNELREMLVDLEEKMFVGQIGSLPSSIDRKAWLEGLLKEGDVTPALKNLDGDIVVRREDFMPIRPAKTTAETLKEEWKMKEEENGGNLEEEWRRNKELNGERGEEMEEEEKEVKREEIMETEESAGDEEKERENEKKMQKEDEEDKNDVLFAKSSFEDLSPVQKLSLALLQIVQAIPLKFFRDPFVVESRSGVRGISTVFVEWQRRLALARSVPAVALHLYTVEPCILWSMSRMQGKCRLCRRKGAAESLVLCVECRNCFHPWCAKLPQPVSGAADSLPIDWLCRECTDIQRRELAKAKRAATREATLRAREEAAAAAAANSSNGKWKGEEDEEMEEGGEGKREQNGHVGEGGDTSKELSTEPESILDLLPKDAIKTSSGRIVKKVFYNENVLAPPVKMLAASSSGSPSSGKRKRESRRARENSWENEDEEEESRSGEEEVTTGGRGGSSRRKSRRTTAGDSYEQSLRTISIGLRGPATNFKEKILECEKAIKQTLTQEFSWPFSAPVDPKEVEDYYEVITQPMDLRTMINKIKNHSYDEEEGVLADFDQIIANCNEYNPEDSPIRELGAELREYLRPRLERILQLGKR